MCKEEVSIMGKQSWSIQTTGCPGDREKMTHPKTALFERATAMQKSKQINFLLLSLFANSQIILVFILLYLRENWVEILFRNIKGTK